MDQLSDYRSIQLEREADEPLHMQLSRQLLARIRELPPNGRWKMPSERSLVDFFKLHRSTVHRAYAELEEAGVVERMADKSLRIATDARAKLIEPFPVVGVVIPSRFSEYAARKGSIRAHYLDGIIDRSAELEISTIMLQLPGTDASPEQAAAFIAKRCMNLIGLIHLGDRGAKKDRTLRKVVEYAGIPQVFISGTSSLPHIGMIHASPARGAGQLCRELEKIGVRRIGLWVPPPGGASAARSDCFRYVAQDRQKVVCDIFRNNGLEMPEEWRIPWEIGGSDLIGILREKLEKYPPPPCFWCANDVAAQELIAALGACGIEVPEQVGVVGFDGVEPGGPATIRQPVYELGAGAVDLLLEHFRHGIYAGNREKILTTEFKQGFSLKTLTAGERK